MKFHKLRNVEIRAGFTAIQLVMTADRGNGMAPFNLPDKLNRCAVLVSSECLATDQANANRAGVAIFNVGPRPVFRATRLLCAVFENDPVIANSVPPSFSMPLVDIGCVIATALW